MDFCEHPVFYPEDQMLKVKFCFLFYLKNMEAKGKEIKHLYIFKGVYTLLSIFRNSNINILNILY